MTRLISWIRHLSVAIVLWGATANAVGKPSAVYVFDIWKFFEEEEIESTLDRVDFVYFITALQGIVNRDKPQLYLNASLSLLDIETRLSTAAGKPIEVSDLDRFWMDYLLKHGVLEGRSLVETVSLSELLTVYHEQISGLALWEMKVPATVNAALTAAGTRNLLPVSSDLGTKKLRSWIEENANGLQIKIDFTGQFKEAYKGKQCSVNGVDFTSSGSTKTDVYRYLRKAFLETGAASPFYMYFNSDAIMWGERRKMYSAASYGYLGDRNELQQNGIFNNDYWVAKRGLFVDLYVWDDQAPNDDPKQEPGTDWNAWNDILETSFHIRKGEFGIVGGFVPWWIKYADKKHEGVATEWRFIDLITSYNMVNDADAAFGLSNASFFMHMPPLDRAKIPPPPKVFPELKEKTVYLTFFMMDYDGSAWLNQAAEAVYQAGGRGRVPLNWAINPVLADRVPHAFRYMVENRTVLDFFGIEDNGAGYLSPERLIPGKRLGRIQESGIPFYERYARGYHQRQGIKMTAFYVTPQYSPEWGEMASRLTPSAFGMNIPSPLTEVGETQVANLESFHVNEVQDLTKFVERMYRESASGEISNSVFYPVRCILFPPYSIADIVQTARKKYPDAKVEVTDAFTFYHLRGRYFETRLDGPFRMKRELVSSPEHSDGIEPVTSNVVNDGYGRFGLLPGPPSAWILRGGGKDSRLFFRVDSAFGQQNDNTDCEMIIDYLDNVEGEMALRYVHGKSSTGSTQDSVILSASGVRKSAVYRLSSPHFVQGMHHRSDVALTGPDGLKIYSVRFAVSK